MISETTNRTAVRAIHHRL